MGALSDDIGAIKFVHTYGAGLHSGDTSPDVHDPRWQRRQVEDFVEFAVLAEELGFDGITLTEHHAPLMTCPSPHRIGEVGVQHLRGAHDAVAHVCRWTPSSRAAGSIRPAPAHAGPRGRHPLTPP